MTSPEIADEIAAFNAMNAAVDLLTCTCGHYVEDHEPVGTGAGGCEICPCAQFVADDEATAATYREALVAVEQASVPVTYEWFASYCETHGLANQQSHWCPCEDVVILYERVEQDDLDRFIAAQDAEFHEGMRAARRRAVEAIHGDSAGAPAATDANGGHE